MIYLDIKSWLVKRDDAYANFKTVMLHIIIVFNLIKAAFLSMNKNWKSSVRCSNKF